jgi:hypothetical protein
MDYKAMWVRLKEFLDTASEIGEEMEENEDSVRTLKALSKLMNGYEGCSEFKLN